VVGSAAAATGGCGTVVAGIVAFGNGDGDGAGAGAGDSTGAALVVKGAAAVRTGGGEVARRVPRVSPAASAAVAYLAC
jgi:hypothetical protein